MKLKEFIPLIDLEKIIRQHKEKESSMNPKIDRLEKRIIELEARLGKNVGPTNKVHSKKRRLAGWATGIGAAALVLFSSGYLARKQVTDDLSSVHNDIGILYKFKGEYNKAAYQYERSIELDGRNKYTYHNLGTLYLDIGGDYNKAEQYLRKAIGLRPDYAPSHDSLGDVYFRMKKYGMAEAEYRRAVDIDPALADAYTGLGAVCDLLGKKDDAEKYRRIAGELSNKK